MAADRDVTRDRISSARRISLTGGPGSGKTSLAKRIASATGFALIDLDGLMLDAGFDMASVVSANEAETLASGDAWVSDGVYLGWAAPWLKGADIIILLDTPARVALYRIVVRHLKAELARNNRFPGWRRLFRFVRWSVRYYRNANAHELNQWGAPETRSCRLSALDAYREKLVVCRTNRESDRLVEALSRS